MINPSSAASSRHCSPVAFAFSNDSRDSFNNTNNKNSYSNQSKNYDFHDEDSNSSQFSNLSNDCYGKAKENKTRTKKKKTVDETDSLRENLIYMNYGCRAPKSTKELIVKFNIKGDTKIVKNDELHKPFSSLSAQSSPSISLAKNGENYFIKRNGFHSEDNSLDGFDNNFFQKKYSPPSLINESSLSPTSKSCDSYLGEKYSNDEEIDNNSIYESKIKKESKKRDSIVSVPTISKIDQEIQDIYSKLPKINEEDILLMKQFQFDDNDDSFVEANQETGDTIDTSKNLESAFNNSEDEYETFEYEEEYEEERNVDEEMDIDDIDDLSNNQMSLYSNNNQCDISNCDIINEQNITNSEKSMELSGNDDHYSFSESQHNPVAISSSSDAEIEPVVIADDNDNLTSHKNSINNTLYNKDNDDLNENENSVDEKQPVELDNKIETSIRSSMLNEEQLSRKHFVKKKRKCIQRSSIKKSLVDRLANDQWESFNGNYDKDNVWHDYSEMTSSYVLTGGENVNNKTEENVLHILPYVNCTW